MILSYNSKLATNDEFDSVRGAELKIAGLAHPHTGATEYDFSAKGGREHGRLILTDFMDTTESSIDWNKRKYLLLCVAEFRDSADGFRPRWSQARDQIHFIIFMDVGGIFSRRHAKIRRAKLFNQKSSSFASRRFV